MDRPSASAALAALVVLLAVAGSPAQAQYLYLDANGDGVHDASDVLPSTGVTTADVWLVTNESRDGTPVECAAEPGTALSISSYEFILRAEGGTVEYGAFENLVLDYDRSFGVFRDATDFYAGFCCGAIKPPGKYHLGRLPIGPRSGTPRISIATSTRLNPPGYTSFGSRCPGLDGDNTMKLGSDWTDADGLPAAGVTGAPPLFAQTNDIVVQEGGSAFRVVSATDTDSDSLDLSLGQAPSFASLTTTSSSRGAVSGRVTLAPSFTDAGTHSIPVVCSDGVLVSTLDLGVFVLNVNPPPVIDAGGMVTVALGSIVDHAVTAHDADMQPIEIRLVSAPPFVTLGPTEAIAGGYRAIARIAPGPSDAGEWDVRLEATDQTTVTVGWLRVQAYDADIFHAPALDSIPDFTLAEGDTVEYTVIARDVDGNSIYLILRSPKFMWFESPGPWFSDPGLARWPLWIAPGPSDAGEWEATIDAVDWWGPYPSPDLGDSQTFRISVSNRPFPPQVKAIPAQPCVQQGEVYTVLLSVSDPDADPFTTTFGPPPTWGTSFLESPTSCRYELSPTSDTPPQVIGLTVHNVDAAGAGFDVTVPLTVGVAGDCPRGSVFAEEPYVEALTADAGDPLVGDAGSVVRFEGRAAVTPARTLLRYEWNFGDGTSFLGRTAGHAYREGGAYRAILTVTASESHGRIGARDTVTVTIRDALPARAFLAPDQAPIVLRAARAVVTLRMERVGEEYALESLVPASLCLWSPGNGEVDSIFAQTGKMETIGDRDQNGVPERKVTFAKEDIRRLFANVRGKRSIPARLQARLPNGARVRAPLDLVVLGAPARAVAVWPNPMNPQGVIAFEAKGPGRAVVRLYDVGGRLVRTLLDGRVEPGEVRVRVDGKDSRGRAIASGVYYYQVSTGDDTWRGRVTILR